LAKCYLRGRGVKADAQAALRSLAAAERSIYISEYERELASDFFADSSREGCSERCLLSTQSRHDALSCKVGVRLLRLDERCPVPFAIGLTAPLAGGQTRVTRSYNPPERGRRAGRLRSRSPATRLRKGIPTLPFRSPAAT
jgi:hypothetical protein